MVYKPRGGRWYLGVAPDPIDTVASELPGYYYHCPDVEALDNHIISIVRDYCGPNSNQSPARQRALRGDIDRLLERRLYMKLMEAGDAA